MNSTELIIKLKNEGKSLRSIVEESGISLGKVRTIIDSTKEESIASSDVPSKLLGGEVKQIAQKTQAASDSICGLISNYGKPCPMGFTSEPCPWKHASDCPYTPEMV